MEILLPEQLNEYEVVDLINNLIKNIDNPEEILIDCSLIRFAQPFGTLIAAEAIRNLNAYRLKKGFKTGLLKRGVQSPPFSVACSYLAHVGFFKHMGWDAGKEPGEAPGGESYLPLTIIKSMDFGRKVSSKVLANLIKKRSEQLAQIVFNSEDAQHLLSYCFTETIRNVFEHSGANRCSVMAQKYKGRKVEIAVIDAGCGIRESFDKKYPGIDELNALNYAVQPGVSGIDFNEKTDKEDSENTGFGLYVLSKLGASYGSFSLWSGRYQLNLQRYLSKQSDIRPFLQGTAVKITVDTTDSEYFPNWLEEIVREGEAKMPPYALKQDGPSKHSRGMW